MKVFGMYCLKVSLIFNYRCILKSRKRDMGFRIQEVWVTPLTQALIGLLVGHRVNYVIYLRLTFFTLQWV